MKQKFGKLRRDVQFGLKCKLFLRQGDWRKAETVWRELREPNSEINNAMLRPIFELKSKDGSLSLVDRQQARDEVALLDPDLRNVDPVLRDAHEPEDI
jgi:hypothetical protein